MNLSNVLSIGANGLAGAAHGTNVSSQNITNAATPGYTRRIANLEPIPIKDGGGVRANGSTRELDSFLERRGLGARAQAGEADARVRTLNVLDTVFSDGQGTVGEALDAFESALSDFAATPNSPAVRQVALARADDLAQAFHRTSEALSGARVDANSRISNDVVAVNQKITEIGALGAQIVAARNIGQEAGDLEDQRDQLIRGIADIMPVNVISGPNGAVTVMLAGSRTLVGLDNEVHLLQASTELTSGDVRIYRATAGAQEDITQLFTTGSIGGTIAARDGALANARTALDNLAFDMAGAYNTQHAAGIGLDGGTARDLFTPAASAVGMAATLSVSSTMLGHPEYLAAAQSATSLPGDNRNAQLLLAVRDLPLGLGGTATAQQAFSAMVAQGGSAARSALDQANHASATLNQIETLRESVSGVSTDEEMISLMKFQRAYQASLRVIETADSMLGALMSMNFGG